MKNYTISATEINLQNAKTNTTDFNFESRKAAQIFYNYIIKKLLSDKTRKNHIKIQMINNDKNNVVIRQRTIYAVYPKHDN